jgi:peptide/nickel transport system substrate-binding protein
MKRAGVRKPVKLLAVVASLGMVAAACGGGKKSANNSAGATTSTSEEVTSTTVAGDVTGASTSTTAVGAAGTSGNATTATTKKSTSSAAKSSTATTAKKTTSGANQPTGGITNVTSAQPTTPAADVQIGGTITYLKGSDSAGFDPINLTASTGADAPASFAEFGALVYSDPADGVVKPQMADSLTSTDALVWTLKLRPNVKFTDGTAYDAAAVQFNWARIADPKNAAKRASSAQSIAQMDVVDPLTLKITLKAKNAVFPQTVALIPYIGSPTAIQQRGSSFNDNPVGAGPFTLKSWTRDSEMVFVRNPTYWDAPRPYIDQLVEKPIIDETQRANTLLSGAANTLFTVTPQTADQLKKGGAVEYAAVQNGGPNIYFNMRSGKQFADPRARKAVVEAIDRCDLAKVVLNGAVECEDSLFRHNSPYYDPSIVQLPYNPTDAQALFDQLAAENGGTFKFTITNFPTGNFPAEGQYIQSKLNAFKNVKVDLVTEAVNLHVTNVNSGNFDVAIYSNPFDDPEPTWTSVFTCKAAPSPTGYCNPKFDAAVADNQLTLNAQQRINDLKDAQKQFYADVPAVYFERRVTWNFGAQNVKDLQFINDGTILWDRIWIKTK